MNKENITKAKLQLGADLSEAAREHIEFLVREIFKIFADNVCKHPYTDYCIISNALCSALGISIRELLDEKLHDYALQLVFVQINANRQLPKVT